jgi:hypothetical protein
MLIKQIARKYRLHPNRVGCFLKSVGMDTGANASSQQQRSRGLNIRLRVEVLRHNPGMELSTLDQLATSVESELAEMARVYDRTEDTVLKYYAALGDLSLVLAVLECGHPFHTVETGKGVEESICAVITRARRSEVDGT